jgi:Asp-tRNA(Asn)/Glu-tRNA(Gln) amidotransferase A subunit family amidase
MPVGIQLVGHKFADTRLLAIAQLISKYSAMDQSLKPEVMRAYQWSNHNLFAASHSPFAANIPTTSKNPSK